MDQLPRIVRGWQTSWSTGLAALLLLMAIACVSETPGAGQTAAPQAPPPGSLTIAYSPEKGPLFLKLVEAFNRSPSRPEGAPQIHAVKLDMADMLEEAVAGEFAAISPDSSVWLAQLDRLWQERNQGASPLVGSISRYALSPVVIAMWVSQAKQMGYPGKKIGWADLMERGSTDSNFKWSHPSPTTASGLLATTAEFYAGAGKSTNLTTDDLRDEATIEYVKAIEATVGRYGGESEDKTVARLLQAGTTSLDAFVAQEQLVIFFNLNTQGEKLIAIYPKEGTFWMDHPLALLEGPWVTSEQRRGFREFAKFVAETAQQRLVLAEGYRPAKLTTSLQEEGSLIRPEYNVDPNEPKTLLKVPSPPVLASIREAWQLTKRPANIYLVVDTSGSMRGEKMTAARGALLSFVEQVKGDRDRLALVTFANDVRLVIPLKTLDENRRSLKSRANSLEAAGGTALYDAVVFAYDRLQRQSDPERINAMVVMTGGKASSGGQFSLDDIGRRASSADTPVLIFTVAYGSDADLDVLKQIAELGEGQTFTSDPETIRKLYRQISQFF